MTRFIVGATIAVFVLSIIGVIALNNLFAVDTSAWDAQTVLIWVAIPAVFLLGIVIRLLTSASDQA